MERIVNRRSLYGFEMREPDFRRNDEGRKTHNIKQLWQRSHEILSLAVRGLKQVEIAEILSLTPQTVSNVLNSDLGMKKLSELRKVRDEDTIKVAEEIDKLTKKALRTYNELFDSAHTTDELKKKTADTVMLELSGYRVPTRIQSQSFNTISTLKEIEEFKERGKKAARESGMIVDLDEEDYDSVDKTGSSGESQPSDEKVQGETCKALQVKET